MDDQELKSFNVDEAAFWVDWSVVYLSKGKHMESPRQPTVKFYKDGDVMGIQTTEADPGLFLNACAARIGAMIEDGLFAHDWEFQLQAWLPQIVEVACRLKGYKADVREDRLITAGYFEPSVDSLVAAPSAPKA